MDEREYSLIEHLADLRKRVARAMLGVVVVAAGAFFVSDELLAALREPMIEMVREIHGADAKFIATSPAEYFMSQMKIALVAGLLLASPWVLYQIWLFIAPGLYDHEKRYVSWFVWAGALCFVGGAAFAYYVAFPPMFRFFVETTHPDVAMTPSIAEHLSFALKMLLAFGVVFETPVVIFILSVAGIIDPAALGKYRRYVVVAAFIIAAVLTPSPDVLSQLLLAGPLLLLYEAGIFVSKMVVKVKGTPLSRKERAEQYAREQADKAA